MSSEKQRSTPAYVDRIWLRSYQHGVPAEVAIDEFSSLGEMFEKSVERYRDRVAYATGPLGAYAEVHVLPERHLVHLPEAVSFQIPTTSKPARSA